MLCAPSQGGLTLQTIRPISLTGNSARRCWTWRWGMAKKFARLGQNRQSETEDSK